MWQNHLSGKRVLLFCLVFVLVCSCVWAFPSSKKAETAEPVVIAMPTATQVESQPVVVPVTVSETTSQGDLSVTLQSTASVTAQSKASSMLLSLQSELENEKRLNKAQVEELKATLTQVQADVQLVNAAAAETEQNLIDALAVNAQQADQLAVLQKEMKPKALTDITLKIGFKNGEPTYGVGAGLGVVFPKSGVYVKGDVGYTIGTFTAKPYDWSLDNLSAGVTIGKQW